MTSLTLPRLVDSELVAAPEESVPGAWAGGPSVVASDDAIYLAYRMRRPVGAGRGYRNVIARSVGGVHFETVSSIERDTFITDSLERPCLVRTPSAWRLYVSCATPGTKHWRVEMLESATVEGLADATPLLVLPGSGDAAVKDPVIVRDGGRWHLWASVHPLASWDDADRMTTDYATSTDGLDWTWHGTVLAGRGGEWDARGVRVSAVRITGEELVATYDGRATAADNWEETTGVAVGRRGTDGRFGELRAVSGGPLVGPAGGLRYLAMLALPGGATRWYYEITRPDGAHELRTELVRPVAV